MKRFDGRAVREAIDFAEAGGQALHVWTPVEGSFPNAPAVFKRHKVWAHLMDNDKERLIATVKKLGVKVIKVGREGGRGQHIDLCGAPLAKAIAQCEKEKSDAS